MATIVERNGRFTAQIRRLGPDKKKRSVAKTFASYEEAKAWADKVEAWYERSNAGTTPAIPLEVAALPRFDAVSGSCGVYFLFDGDECVYVGKSLQVHTRVREHRANNASKKEFDTYAFIPCKAAKLDELEAHYIAMMKPKFNESLNPDRKRSKSWNWMLQKKLRESDGASQVFAA